MLQTEGTEQLGGERDMEEAVEQLTYVILLNSRDQGGGREGVGRGPW